MNAVNREIARLILRTLADYARGSAEEPPGYGGFDTSESDQPRLRIETAGREALLSKRDVWQLLPGLTPIEIENIVDQCAQHFRIDIPSVAREILRHRNEALLIDLVRAGAGNSLLRELFGIPPRQLTRLREAYGSPQSARRRLSEEEVRLVQEHANSMTGQDGSQLQLAAGSLEIARELGLPLMPVYRCVVERAGRSHDQS